ncbi:spore germination protein [Psychrobacillus sp.]|uniref:spore germination protein n=1 Tax=Psychrobacillus sp. TaxID=1871623 RepID=UPI0028BDF540|nr:spore germination protein [Psychrobacillus sp.]
MQSEREKIESNTLHQLFKNSADVQFQEYAFQKHKVMFITCNAMIDLLLLNDVIVKRVQQMCDNIADKLLEETVFAQLHIPDLKKVEDMADAISLVYTGHLLLFFEDEHLLFSSNIEKKPNRNPEESRMEVLIKGPRDNFIEDISVNIALIRKRLPTNSLCVENFILGKRSQTKVSILYFDDIANKGILDEIKEQLNKVDTDIIFSGDILMERVNKSAKIFPRNDYTGRPDFAIQALVRGRFIIFVDGVSYAMITPVNLFLLLKSGEDNEYPIIFSSLERILRVTGILIGLFLPAFWLALTSYHQNQLPLQLLATVVQANTGLPLPSALEMLLMLVMFELFREAGLRLPSVIGGTISVVGGLIIGDAAIRAGLTSPAMIVIIAISTIATFTLVNQSLVTAVSILRISFIIVTAFFGLFGFFIAFHFTILYLSSIRVFGVPYMNIASDLNWSTISKSLLRMPAKYYKKRPKSLDPQDETRTKEVEK